MNRPRMLVLYCGAGGSSMGYHRAGFDIFGVDINPQPHYPFDFQQGDALTFPLDGFDAIHASPVCKGYTVASLSHRRRGKQYPNQIPATRERLIAAGVPWVIENVPRAPLRADFKLCGCMFGLVIPGGYLRRERWFETNWPVSVLYPAHHHVGVPVTIAGHGQPSWTRRHGHKPITVKDWRAVSGIDWMNRDELAQAIPPAYTEYIGRQLLDALRPAA